MSRVTTPKGPATVSDDAADRVSFNRLAVAAGRATACTELADCPPHHEPRVGNSLKSCLRWATMLRHACRRHQRSAPQRTSGAD